MNKLNLTPIPLEFLPGGHVHKLNGKRVPGVTTVSGMFEDDGWKFAWPVKVMEEEIKEYCSALRGQGVQFGLAHDYLIIRESIFYGFLNEARNAWREKRDKSADSGTIAHEMISYYLNNGAWQPFTENKEVENCIENFIKWEKLVKPEWLASEVQVGSMTHQFAGILDSVAIINGKKVLVDFKTGDKIKLKDMKGNEFIKYSIVAQLAGLQLCLEEQGFVPDERAILHLPKEGKYEYVPVCTDVVQDQKDFLNALTFYRSKNLFQGRNKRIWVDHKPIDVELETDEPLLEDLK